jgi:orotate phosphoribosyltransferase
VYVGPNEKDHGKMKRIEVISQSNQSAIVIEDLVITFKSVVCTVEVLRSHGVNVQYWFAVFSYELQEVALLLGSMGIRIIFL